LIIVDRKPRSRTGARLAEQLYHAKEDGVVNWTGRYHQYDTTLNAKTFTDKLRQLKVLDEAGVSITPFKTTRPRGDGWLPRRKFHQQGRDFKKRRKPFTPDYWTKFVPLSQEWRLHVFRTAKGKYAVIRSGLKVAKTDDAHPWVRGHSQGWKISYVGGAPDTVKETSRAALKALDLDFGAVDIGVSEDGKPIIIEINTCPGLDTGTLKLYVDAIKERCHGKARLPKLR
jgi:hypothetical protein